MSVALIRSRKSAKSKKLLGKVERQGSCLARKTLKVGLDSDWFELD